MRPTVTDSVLDAIGRTPLVRLKRVVEPHSADVLAKLEYYNPTGSYKDSMALAMIEGAETRDALRPGMRVVEFTGGSTGSSLALVCAVKGYGDRPGARGADRRRALHAFCGAVGTAGMVTGVSKALKAVASAPTPARVR